MICVISAPLVSPNGIAKTIVGTQVAIPQSHVTGWTNVSDSSGFFNSTIVTVLIIVIIYTCFIKFVCQGSLIIVFVYYRERWMYFNTLNLSSWCPALFNQNTLLPNAFMMFRCILCKGMPRSAFSCLCDVGCLHMLYQVVFEKNRSHTMLLDI